MGWYLHHVNIQAFDVMETAAFYRDLIGLEDGVWAYPDPETERQENPRVRAFFGSQNRGIHVVGGRPDFQAKNGLSHNPTIGGHFAMTVADADAVKARLEAAGYMVSDAGVYAMAGMRQLYVYDPDMNVIEINEAVDASAGPGPEGDEAHGVRTEPGDWFIHHVNLPAHDVRRTAAFFSDLVGIEEGVWQTAAGSPETNMVNDRTRLALFGDDNRGLHIVKPVPDFAKRNGFDHNPTVGGHFAITVKDLDATHARLKAAGVLVTDAGSYAMAGMRQLYAYDPSMNLVEINQVVG